MSIQSLLYSLEGGEWATIAEIAERCRVPRRTVEGEIESLRLQGVPIIAGPDGVRVTSDPAEIRSYAASRRRRLLAVALGTKALLRAARRLDVTQGTLGL